MTRRGESKGERMADECQACVGSGSRSSAPLRKDAGSRALTRLRHHPRLAAALLLVVGAVAAYAVFGRSVPFRPFRYSCWYWHRPFLLTGTEQRRLRQAGIERLYVYAGTLTARGTTLRVTRRQEWRSKAPCPVYAVIRVDPASHDALLSPAGAAQAAALVAADARLSVAPGLQWDADIPTGRLPQYAAFLRCLRGALRPGQVLSVTALPDWLRGDYRSVCDAVDEVAPQFYGNEWPEVGRKPPPLWETSRLLSAIRASTGGRARVWVGLPAYGRCVVMDERQQPVGMRHDLEPEALLDDPAWELATAETRRETWGSRSTPTRGEDLFSLRCREATTAGPMAVAPGAQLWFQWPRIEGLAAAVAQIRALALPGVDGVCFFRWPAPGEPLAVPLSRLAAFSASDPQAAVREKLEIRFERAGQSVRVAVSNRGVDCPTLPEVITLEVTPPRNATVLANGPIRWQQVGRPASARWADRAIFSRPFLRPGRRWEVCRVTECSGPLKVVARWQDEEGRWRAQSAREGPLALPDSTHRPRRLPRASGLRTWPAPSGKGGGPSPPSSLSQRLGEGGLRWGSAWDR